MQHAHVAMPLTPSTYKSLAKPKEEGFYNLLLPMPC
jgi:hypothetical protein